MKTSIELLIEVEIDFNTYRGKPIGMAIISLPPATEVFDKYLDEIEEACWEAAKEAM